MKILCESIEYIPFTLETECHYKKSHNVEVVKFKNLKIDNGGDGLFISGKSFPFLIGHYNLFHTIPDLCGQFEALSFFDKDISPFFISEGQIKNFLDKDSDIHYFISYIYSKFYNINQKDSFDITKDTIVFEEAYFIIDFHKLIPRDVYVSLNAKIPEWFIDGEETKWQSNTACLKIDPLVKTPKFNSDISKTIFHSEYSNNYDYFIRHGIESFKKRVLQFLNKKNVKSKGVYISRVNTTRRYIEDLGSNHDLVINRCYQREFFFENYFKNLGYEIVYMEDLNYAKQLEVLLNTENVVALHGSALVNTFICDEETNVYEIMLPEPKNNWWQNFFFFFSPIPGCIDHKNVSDSCITNRRWNQIYEEDYAFQIDKWLTS